jgi:hypothetical protein
MKPSAPAGCLVVVRPVASQDVGVGDALVVQATDATRKPVFHRVR